MSRNLSIGLIGLLAVGWGAGCSSSQMSRIDRNRDIYEQWPIEVRQAVLDGKVEPGMTPDMVRVAWGNPTEIVTQSAGGDEIWVYKTGGDDGSVLYPGGGGMSGMGGGNGIIVGTGRGGTIVAPTVGIGIGGGGMRGGGLGGGIGGLGGGDRRTWRRDRRCGHRRRRYRRQRHGHADLHSADTARYQRGRISKRSRPPRRQDLTSGYCPRRL